MATANRTTRKSSPTVKTANTVKRVRASAEKPLTRKELMEYITLSEYRRTCEKEAREAKKLEDPIAEKIHNHLNAAKVKPGQSIRLWGYDLGLAFGGRYPAWKQLFIEFNGEEEAARAIEATPPAVCLVVEKATRSK